jgi:hypothetical protein
MSSSGVSSEILGRETRTNLQEAVDLVLEANRTLAEESLRGQEVIKEPLLLA